MTTDFFHKSFLSFLSKNSLKTLSNEICRVFVELLKDKGSFLGFLVLGKIKAGDFFDNKDQMDRNKLELADHIVNKIPQDIVKKTRSNIQGLDLLTATPDYNPDQYFFLKARGLKKRKSNLVN